MTLSDEVNEEDVAELVFCSECGDDAICINENILPLGTCMNCGHVNDVHICDRCAIWFNHDEDGMYEEDIAVCQNCLGGVLEE